MALKKRIVKDKETRQEEIQYAARKIFFKKGFLASTVGEIGKEARVAEGTVYRYFESKEDLYLSLIIPTARNIGKGLAELEKEVIQKKVMNGFDIVMKILDIYYENYIIDRNVFLIFASLLSGFFLRISEDMRSKINDEVRINFLITRRIISEGKNQGFIKKDVNEYVIADLLWSTFLGIAILEESKERGTQKDHIYPTLVEGFSLLAQALCAKAGRG